MTVDVINLNSNQEGFTNLTRNKDIGNTNSLILKAKQLGINLEGYYTYNDQNELSGINSAKLNAAIIEAMKLEAEKNSNSNLQTDSFTKAVEGETDKNIEKVEAKSSKKEIDNEYSDALIKYARTINDDAYSTTEEGQLAEEWRDIKAEVEKLTSSTAPNTTVLEGVKEFIVNLTGLVNKTKNYNAEKEDAKESSLTLETVGDIEDKNNAIKVYQTNIFSSNPFKSAFETFLEEEEQVAV